MDQCCTRTRSELLIFEYVESSELRRVDALETEDLDACSREAALRCLWSALHEQDNRSRADGFVDGLSGLLREKSRLEDIEARREKRVVSRAEGRAEDLWRFDCQTRRIHNTVALSERRTADATDLADIVCDYLMLR